MSFTFLHAADLHLGSPFSGLALKDEEIARRFAGASREAFSELVSRAIEEKVAFAVFAGDIYDGEWKDTLDRPVLQPRDRAARRAQAFRSSSSRAITTPRARSPRPCRCPPACVQFPSEQGEHAAPRRPEGRGAWPQLRGQGRERKPRARLSAAGRGLVQYRRAAHLVRGPPAATPPTRRARCRILHRAAIDYWALGHVHEFEVLSRDPWIVFPGNLQGRSVRECGPKGAVLVDVADGHVTGVRPLIVDKARWASVAVDLAGVTDESGVPRLRRRGAEDAAGRGRRPARRASRHAHGRDAAASAAEGGHAEISRRRRRPSRTISARMCGWSGCASRPANRRIQAARARGHRARSCGPARRARARPRLARPRRDLDGADPRQDPGRPSRTATC